MIAPTRLVRARLVLPAALLTAAGGALLAQAPAALSAEPGLTPLPTIQRTLSAPAAARRADCATTRLPGRPGVTTQSLTIPAGPTVSLAARLAGPAGSDWDLAVFDHATGKRLGGSSAWGASELVQVFAVPGQVLDLQGCRISGPAASVPLSIFQVGLPPAARGSVAEKEQLVHIDLPSPAAAVTLDRLGVDMVEDATPKGVDAVVRTPEEIALIERSGFAVRVLDADLAATDRRNAARTAAYARSARAEGGSALPTGRTEYRHLADTQADLKKLVQQYPSIVKPVTLPKKTFQGRDTMGVEISSDVNRVDDQKPVSFIMGAHHAREWPSQEIPTEFAFYLAQGFGADDEVTQLLRRSRVVIVPIINSDGFNASREATDFADQSGDPGGAPSLAESVAVGGSLAYRRKNCDGPVSNPAVPCDFQTGVDPNRNYGFNWGGVGASSSQNSQSYRGTGPWSEPETQAVHEYSQVRDVTSLLTMHNFASLVLRPPGVGKDGMAPDEVRLKALGDAIAEDTGYTSEYSYQLYDTSGTTEDWNYGAAGTYGYTIEMGPPSEDGGNFHVAYKPAVIDQWTGTGERAGRGLRRALLRIAEASVSRQDFATLVGRAPAGRILRLHKDFQTSTSPVCQIASPTDVDAAGLAGADTSCVNPGDPILVDDKLDYTTKVSPTGTFGWIVTPSTRPFVGKKGGSEAFTLTCEDTAGKVFETRQVTVGRNETQSLDLPCGGAPPAGAPLPTTAAQADASALADRAAPQSTLTATAVTASRTRIIVKGTASDTAPTGLTPRVAKVFVTLGRRLGDDRCRFLTAEGTFGPVSSCLRTKYTVARIARPASKVSFSYVLGAKLPRGRYFTWSRGVDAAGNVERKARARNLRTFKIR